MSGFRWCRSAEHKIDGSTDTGTAREQLKNALSSLKKWNGIHHIRMRESGDGHLLTHLLKANVDAKRWEFALPQQDRIQQPATPK